MKITFRPLVLTLVPAVLSACADREQTTGPVALKGEVVNAGEFLGKPAGLLALGDTLVVLDALAPHVHTIDVADGRHLASFGTSGGGPGEFRSADEVEADLRGDGTFWIYDVEQGRMTRLDPRGGSTAERTKEVINLQFTPGTYFFQPVWLDDSTLVTTGIYPEGRLLLADGTGKPVGKIGQEPPNPPGGDVPISVRQHAHSGPLERSPDGTRLALATRNGDQIELYRSDGTPIRTVQGGSGFGPVYGVRTTPAGVSMTSGQDLRFGYVDLASTPGHLFALFSGTLRGEMPGRAQFGKEVHVYDWDGNRVATFELDERAASIAVDGSGRRLFALRLDPEPAVVRYTLPERLGEAGSGKTASRR